MLKQLLVLTLLLWCSIPALAQISTVQGRVIDHKNKSLLVGVTVRLALKSDSTKAEFIGTDVNGIFIFGRVTFNTYVITASYVGYSPTEKTVVVNEPSIDVGDIAMSVSAVQLGEIVIEGKVVPAEQKADTTEFNAGAFKVHPDADAGDLVTKLPGVSIDNSGVHAQGENVQQVLLDGKPFFGSDPVLALHNLPADAVDKIQVFDQMSDQAQFTGFDDGQSQKTMNIVTRKNRRNQNFGKVYGGYGDDDHYIAGGSVNSFDGDSRLTLIGLSNNVNQQNFSTQDILGVTNNTSNGGGFGGGGGRRGGGGGGGGGYFGGGGGGNPGGGGNSGINIGNFLVGQQTGITNTNSIGTNFNDTFDSSFSLNQGYFFNHTANNNLQNLAQTYQLQQDSQQIYRQLTNSNSSNVNHRFDTRATYFFDSSNSVIFTPHVYFQSNNSGSNLTGTMTNMSGPISDVENINGSEYTGNTISSHLTLRHKFDLPGRTVSLDIGWSSNSKQGTGSIYSLQNYITQNYDSLLNEHTTLNTHGYTISPRLAYTEPVGVFSQVQLTYNPSYTKNNSDNRRYAFDVQTDAFTTPDTLLSNTFNNTYTTQNAGIGYRVHVSTLNVMLNAAYQIASLDGTQIYPFQNVVKRTFYNILPSGMLNYTFSDNTNLRVFYRTSTTAPTIAQLQNVIDNSNPLQLTGGNPNLAQSYGQTILLRYGLTNARGGRSLFIFFTAQQTNNYVANSVFTAAKDSLLSQGIVLHQGSQLTTPVNLDDYWNTRFFLTYGIPIGLISSNFNFTGGYNFTRTPGLVNGSLNLNNTSAVSAGGVISSNISPDVDFTLSYTGNYNIAKNSNETQLNNNYYSQTAGIKFNLIFLDGFVLRNELDNTLYNGLGAGYDENIWLWSLNLAHKFFANQRGELQIGVNDLLNQNKSVSRTITESYVEDIQNEVLGRYFLATFTYTVR